jgi:3-oxoacid CoA-transferase subunit B
MRITNRIGPDSSQTPPPNDGIQCQSGVDRIISDLAVFDLEKNDGGRQLTLTRLAPGVTVEELRGKTEAAFDVALEVFEGTAALEGTLA